MLNSKTFSTAQQQESAVLVGLITQKQDAEKTKEYLEELEFLATTAGVSTKKYSHNGLKELM